MPRCGAVDAMTLPSPSRDHDTALVEEQPGLPRRREQCLHHVVASSKRHGGLVHDHAEPRTEGSTPPLHLRPHAIVELPQDQSSHLFISRSLERTHAGSSHHLGRRNGLLEPLRLQLEPQPRTRRQASPRRCHESRPLPRLHDANHVRKATTSPRCGATDVAARRPISRPRRPPRSHHKPW